MIGSILPMLSAAEEGFGLHLLYRWRGPEKPKADVVVVAIDRESAEAFNLPASANKWPRTLHARLLDILTAQGAAVVAFDLIFHEPQSSVNDQALAEAMTRAKNVILTQPINRRVLPLVGADGRPAARMNIEKLVSAIPIISNAALTQAPFPLPKLPVKLNQFWRFSPMSGDVPTLPVVTMHVYATDALDAFIELLEKVDPDAASVLAQKAGSKHPKDHIKNTIRGLYALFEKKPALAGQMRKELDVYPLPPQLYHLVKALIELYGPGNSRYLNLYGPPETIETVSYHQILGLEEAGFGEKEEKIPNLKGKAVFVGQTQSDWFKANDGFYTAFTETSGMDISGVEIAATAFANLLEDKAVRPLSHLTHAAVFFIWGAVAAMISLHFSALVSAAGLLLVNGLYIWLVYFQFASSGTWYPLVVPVLVQAPAAYTAGLAWKYRKANIERRNIRKAFGQYLPDMVVDQLAANIKNLRAGGQVLYSICLFTDAESYTTLSEELDPESLTRLMNAYYKAIFRPIKENGGIVLQVIGDSVLSLWTAASAQKTQKAAACKAAIEISKAVGRFNATAGPYQLPTRIGIHAGEILLGNIGAMDHFEYRPVGDIVNTASRLEGLNKYLGTYMLTSEDALAPAKGSVTRSVGRFVFKGKARPVRVHEILSPNERRSEKLHNEVQRIFTAGLQAFELQSWDEADHLFKEVLKLNKNDGPSKFYLKLCQKMRATPPGNDWNGAVLLSHK